MTEAQKSFKKKLENSGLHIEEIGGVPILKDGQGRVISGGGGSATWGSIGGTLSNQTDLKNALAAKADSTAVSGKMDKLPEEPYSHTQYKFPFNINPLVQESDKISTSFDTLVMNDGTTRNNYPLEIPAADPANDKAGLYTKDLADAKSKVTASTLIIAGATEAKALTIDGVDYNLPSGGISVVAWGDITGTLSNQTDLQTALDAKASSTDLQQGLATKQASLSDAQLASCNSGITAEKVTAYDGYDARITSNNTAIGNNTAAIALNTAAIATKQKQITYGTADPSGGEDGDVYIKYTA